MTGRAELEEALAAERERTGARVADLSRTLDDIVDAAALEVPDDEHDPEGHTIGFERAQVAALLDAARAHLGDLDRAVARLATGEQATCRGCGGRIPLERLLARPTAETCVACATTGGSSPQGRLRTNRGSRAADV